MSYNPGLRETVIVGGGPAGTALLIAASRMGVLNAQAAGGLAIVEQGPVLGGGQLGTYAIKGDSSAETFLSAVSPAAGPALAALANHPSARAIADCAEAGGIKPVPLRDVASFLDMVADNLSRRVTAGGGAVLTGWRGLHTRQRGDGTWMTMIGDQAGRRRTLHSRNVVIATGGVQSEARVWGEMMAGRSLGDRAGNRLIASGQVLTHDGGAALAAKLESLAQARVVVIGSSTSALASCNFVLERSSASVALLHRRRLRVFYVSAEDAVADGYTDFGPDDICPVSGFVYRLAGLRMEARDLVRCALRIGDRVPHPRLTVHRLDESNEQAAARTIDDADVIIHALGYRPRGLLVLDARGEPVPLAADGGGRLVDEACRVRGANGQPITGLFGLGLAAGFVPSGPLGGEPSFSGQANGLWLWQNEAGAAILKQLQRRVDQAAA